MNDFTKTDAALDAWINSHADEMVAAAQSLLRIPSVLGQPAPGAPFGAETRAALENVIALCERFGLRTKMIDGYAAHAEFGEGEKLIGVLSHVDVVPEGNDWTYEPFGAEIVGDKIYARGAIDDKGPAIASLFAMFAVKECAISVSARIRAILGADEESGFRCVEHYFAHEEMPDVGFTPDGSFPAIYAEKGIASPVLTSQIPSTDDAVKLVELRGGSRSNMVPDRAYAVLVTDHADWSEHRPRVRGESIETEIDGPNRLIISATGVSAHASMPHEGVNALGLLCSALTHSDLTPGLHDWLTTIGSFATDNTGASLGIAGSDDVVGPLTSNLGVATTANTIVSLTFSVRYPVKWTGDDVHEKIDGKLAGSAFSVTGWNDMPPLFVPSDDPLVSTLMEVYRAETGDMQPPKTMGGGTYARTLKKGIAFGPNFPGFPDIAHKADEFWYISEMVQSARIYAKAIARLASAP